MRDSLNEREGGDSTKLSCKVVESSQFVFVTAQPEGVTEALPTFAQSVVSLTRELLGEEICREGAWPMGIWMFRTAEAMYRYMSVYTRGKPFLLAQGVYIRRGMRHIAMWNPEAVWLQKLVLVHEINHALVGHLRMPTWLREGIAQYCMFRLVPVRGLRYLSHENLSRNRFWKERGLGSFWNGRAFKGENAEQAYVIARRAVMHLMSLENNKTVKLRQLLLKSRGGDCGEKALGEVYGLGLQELGKELVGRKEWERPLE